MVHETTEITRTDRWAIPGVAIFMLLCAVLLAAIAPFASGEKHPGVEAELLTGLVTAAVTLALTEFFRRRARLTRAEIGLAPDQRTPVRLIVGLAVGLLIAALWALLCTVFGPIAWRWTPGVGAAPFALQAAAYLLLATREELAFHAYPLWQLRQRVGLWPAQVAIAIVFALEHRLGGMTWTQATLGAGIGSLLFGMASLAGRGIALPIGMHAAWNLVHWSLGMKGKPGLWVAVIEPGREQQAEIVATVAYVSLFAVAIAVLARLERKQRVA